MQEDQRKLYELIWKRTIASQMENAVLEQVKVDLSDGTDDVILRANGSVILFPDSSRFIRKTRTTTKRERRQPHPAAYAGTGRDEACGCHP